jgi:hypothetical protein
MIVPGLYNISRLVFDAAAYHIYRFRGRLSYTFLDQCVEKYIMIANQQKQYSLYERSSMIVRAETNCSIVDFEMTGQFINMTKSESSQRKSRRIVYIHNCLLNAGISDQRAISIGFLSRCDRRV